jgi:hypothetical protein
MMSWFQELWNNLINKGHFAAFGSTLTLGTPIATTSGTSHDFTGIPAGARRITVALAEVSTDGVSGTGGLCVQLGSAGGIENTDYTSTLETQAGTVISTTTAFRIGANAGAAEIASGLVELVLLDPATNTWVQTGSIKSSTTLFRTSAGSKSLSGELTQIRLTTTGAGADTFDAGKVNILYE